jgi:hypothetical protein
MWVAGALTLGFAIGIGAAWFIARRSHFPLPPRRPGQSPADRARELQHVLEGWWLSVRETPRGSALESEMQQLRVDLEAVRFAPGRADHSQTVVDLEARLRRLVRRA